MAVRYQGGAAVPADNRRAVATALRQITPRLDQLKENMRREGVWHVGGAGVFNTPDQKAELEFVQKATELDKALRTIIASPPPAREAAEAIEKMAARAKDLVKISDGIPGNIRTHTSAANLWGTVHRAATALRKLI